VKYAELEHNSQQQVQLNVKFVLKERPRQSKLRMIALPVPWMVCISDSDTIIERFIQPSPPGRLSNYSKER